MDDELKLTWGTIPPVIVDLVRLMAKKAAIDAERAANIKWPDQPCDVQDEPRRAISSTHKTTRAAMDLRSLLSAYAHKFHNPRPVISDLTRAQDAGSQGFIRRYSEGTVDAVESLVSPGPAVETILLAFPSLSIMDLVDLGGPVGNAAKTFRDSDSSEITALNALRRKISNGIDVDQAKRLSEARARSKSTSAKGEL